MAALTTWPRHVNSMRPGWTQFIPPWRRRAGEVRGDQLATAAVGLAGAMIGVTVATFGRDTTLAVCVGLVTLCVTPGCAFVCWHVTTDRLTRVLAVLAVSLTWTILVASLFAWLQVTALGALLAATAGVGGIGSSVFLLGQLTGRLDDSPGQIPTDDRDDALVWTRDDALVWTSVDAVLDRTSRTAPRQSRATSVLLVIALAVAAGLFAVSVIQAHGHTVGSYGLLPLLGISFVAATTLTVAALMLALRSIRTAWPAAAGALCLLLVELNGTPMMFDPTPMGSWAYKHFGVVDYLVHGGALSDPTDIYQQWPGFFAAAAGLARLSGRSSLAYANWAQLFFTALIAIVLFAIARRFAPRHPVVPYITVLLFITVNWEGQIYFSPQTAGFLLVLLFQFFLLSLLEPARLRRPFRNWHWLNLPPLEIQGEGEITVLGTAMRVAGIIALFGAIVITHQLSPFMAFAGVAALWALGVLRRPLLVLGLVILLVAYPLLHLTAVQHNFVLNGFSFSNATGQGATSPTPQQTLAGVLSKVIGLGMWGATAICVLSYRRRLGVVVIPAILAAVPLSFILVSNYDGEGIYRVFLFSSPWCALIIAKRLADLSRLPMLRWTAVGFGALFAALGSGQAQAFGMYPMVQIPRGEISASAYFLDHAPPKSVLILAVANFPSRLNGRYVLHSGGTQNDLSLNEIPAFDGNGLKNTSPESLARSVTDLGGGVGYLAVAPSMESYNEYYGVYAPGTLPSLTARLKTSAYWKVWYENNGTVIFRALPQGKLAGR